MAGPNFMRSPIFGTPQAPQNMFGLTPDAIAERKKQRQIQTIGDTLTALGIGLMGQPASSTPQSPLLGLAQGLQGANQMAMQRSTEAQDQQRMDLAQGQFDMQAQQFDAQQQFEQARRDQMEKLIANLPQDQQNAARADPDTFFKAYAESLFPKQNAQPSSVQEYEYAKGQGYQGTFQDWQREQAKMNQQDASLRYGLNPVYGQDAQGNTVMMLPNNQGGVKVVSPPPGVSISPQTQFLDTGTSFVPMDKRNPTAPVGPEVAKNPAGEASAKAQGTAQGEAAAALPSYANSASTALQQVDELLAAPGINEATGLSSVLDPRNYIPGSDAYNFKERLKQLSGGVFLQAYQQLRGGGAITETEGQQAKQAVARMNAAQSKEAFVQALNDYKAIINKGLSVAKQKATAAPVPPGGGAAPATVAPTDTSDPLGLKGGS